MSKSENKINIPDTEVKTVSITEIDEGTRFRKDYGDLSDLCFSIKTHGLINPITVCPKPEGGYLLIAGGRRLEALRKLESPEAIVRIFKNIPSEIDLRLIELAENLQRKEMTWAESNSLQREIHRLQQEKYGAAVRGQKKMSEGGHGWSLEDTANMLGVSESQVKQSVSLADKFDKYKDILGDPKKFKTENDARKAIKTVEEALVRAELAKRAVRKESGNSILNVMSERFQIGDVFDKLAKIPSESVDFVECDPPYGINLDEVKNGDTTNYHEVQDKDFIIFHAALLKEINRILKPDTFCILWFALDPWLEILYKLALEQNFTTTRRPLVWVKPNGQSLSPSTSLASAYETALILKKGNPILSKPGRINVFDFKPVPPTFKHHPTQKPIELYKEIFETFSFENANCVSPFAGSGAALIAAQLCLRKCIGFDLSEKFKEGFLQDVAEIFMGA